MIGIVAALFCTLVIAGLCSYCFNTDLKWYYLLNKPPFMVNSGWFTLFVSISYVSSILAVSRLVEYKHFFPSMIFFCILGVACVFFVWCFFTLHSLIAALVFMTIVLAMAYVLLVRFMMKDYKIALEFAPAFLFDMYGFLCVLSIVMLN